LTTNRPYPLRFTPIKGSPLLGVLPQLHRDALSFFTRVLSQHGDRITFRVLGRDVLLLGHPDDFERVLITDRERYGRSREIRNLRPIFGDGLLASSGALWRRQRRLIQPRFSHDSIAAYAEVMVDCIAGRTAQWEPGQRREMHAEMMHFTRDVVCRTLFGSEPGEDVETIANAVRTVFSDLRAEILYLPLWRRLPLSRSRRWNRAVEVLNRAIRHLIADRRASRQLRPDLLGVLLSVQDEDGTTMSDQQIHDEILTMFLAGHETSALSLSWAIHLLASHPEVQQKAADEVAAVTSGRPIRAADYPRLHYLKAIVEETMRLYPSVWSLGRNVEQNTELDGNPIAKGTHVWLCIYHMHRDVRWFPEPDRFLPERWLEVAPSKRFCYLPFGAGPRMCIGQHFAMAEAVLALASILQEFRLSDSDGGGMEAWITLRPKDGVKVMIERAGSGKTGIVD